ncbi:HAMP domain-containing sensor histidine kinase [Bacillus sp. 03113]|uniref:HAMP domain-containing sensor histidine kinase n=1 Tax=Bacillus sp. 03113 TaxID=2578211 RepID=UPI001143CD70|nr:HAMP domain-containing sensor histidine kinase [Bacillus sp. 03113]
MKLKLKLPLLFSFIIMILAVMIAIYIKMDVIESIITRVTDIRHEHQLKDRVIPLKIEELYPDVDAIEAYMKKTITREKITLSLYDPSFKELYVFRGARKDREPSETWYQIKDHNGETVLLLKLQRPLNPQDIILKTVFSETLLLLMIALALIFIALTIYLHYLITKPIQNLNKRLRNIKYHSPFHPIMHNRKDEIGELFEHVSEMQERIHQSNKEQIDMVAAITHDLKTPLTSINGFIELLLTKKSLSEIDKEEYLNLIGKKSRDITDLINEFSAFTKNEVLLPSISFHSIRIKDFFESVAIEYEAELSGLDYELFWEHHFANECFSINEPMLRRVFANLFSNSVRYGAKEELEVYMNGYLKGEYAFFVIEDNGIGVPDSDLAFLFQRFFTVDQSRQSETGGTGLGLASCQSIIERHGGEIRAFHSQKGGLGIKFSIPIDSH